MIVSTASGALYKGFDFILRTPGVLRHNYGADFEWKVYGNVEPTFFEHVTGIRHEDVGVRLYGVASAEQLVEAFEHLYGLFSRVLHRQ